MREPISQFACKNNDGREQLMRSINKRQYYLTRFLVKNFCFKSYPHVLDEALKLAITLDYLLLLKYFIFEQDYEKQEPIYDEQYLLSFSAKYVCLQTIQYIISEKVMLNKLNYNCQPGQFLVFFDKIRVPHKLINEIALLLLFTCSNEKDINFCDDLFAWLIEFHNNNFDEDILKIAFYIASVRGHIEKIKLLSNHYQFLSKQSFIQNIILPNLISENQPVIMRFIVKNIKFKIEKYIFSLIIYGAAEQKTAQQLAALSHYQEFYIQAVERLGQTPLLFAAEFNNISGVQWIIHFMRTHNMAPLLIRTSLDAEFATEEIELIPLIACNLPELILLNPLKLSAPKISEIDAAALVAGRFNHGAIMEWLILEADAGQSDNSSKEIIDRLLIYAAKLGNLPLVKFLAKKNACIEYLYGNSSPLQVALKNKHYHVVKFLLEHGSAIGSELTQVFGSLDALKELPASTFNHALLIGCKIENRDILSVDISEGSLLGFLNTAILSCAQLRQILFHRYMSSTQCEASGYHDISDEKWVIDDVKITLLCCRRMLVSRSSDVVLVYIKGLIGILTSITNEGSLDQLCINTINQNPRLYSIVKLSQSLGSKNLLSKLTVVQEQENNFRMAAGNGCVKKVADLIAYIDINCASSINGRTALHWACENMHITVVRLLLDKNADVNKCDNKLTTALHIVVARGTVNIVQLMLAHSNKANPNLCDNNGETVLHLACRHLHTEIVVLLLGIKETNLFQKNLAGETAIDVLENAHKNFPHNPAYDDIVKLFFGIGDINNELKELLIKQQCYRPNQSPLISHS